jgi:hypothetical protein
MMVKITLTILFALSYLLVPYASQDQRPAEKSPVLTFADLQRNDSIEAPFTVVGYVIETYKCPPCPEGAMCKPCIGDHIVVTDTLDEKDPALRKRLRIFTDQPEKFALREKYSFLVKARGTIPKGQPLNSVDLLAQAEHLGAQTQQ